MIVLDYVWVLALLIKSFYRFVVFGIKNIYIISEKLVIFWRYYCSFIRILQSFCIKLVKVRQSLI